MKILLVKSFSRLSSVGHLAIGLKKLGHDVHILVPEEHADCAEMRDRGIPVHIVDIRVPSPFWHPVNALAIARNIFRLAVFLRRHAYDVIHLNLVEARLFGRLASLCSRSAVVSTIHGFETFCERLMNFMDDATVCVTETVREYAIAHGVRSEHAVTIHNAVDLEEIDRVPVKRHHVHAELRLDPRVQLIGMVSYFYDLYSKGHRVFLDAAKIIHERFPAVRFALVGSDLFGEGYQRHFEQYARAAGIGDCTYFLGEREDIVQCMDSFYVLVMPTIREGFGMVLIEAMARRTPAVASRLEALEEVILDGETGVLFEAGNAEDLSDRLTWLIEHPDRVLQLGENGRSRVERHFNAVQMAQRHEAVFQNAITVRTSKDGLHQIVQLLLGCIAFPFQWCLDAFRPHARIVPEA